MRTGDDEPRGPRRTDDGHDRDDPACDPVLGDVLRAMRAEVPPRDAWRRELLDRVEREGSDAAWRRPRRRVVLHPAAAAAAALLLVALGAAGSVSVMRARAGAGATSGDAIASSGSVAAGAAVIADRSGGATFVPAASTGDAGAESGTVRFVIVAPRAGNVSIVGDFNYWNPSSRPMRRSDDGRTWIAEVPLPPGRHAYAFVVDGVVTADPAAPRASGDDFGQPNSVILVPPSRL